MGGKRARAADRTSVPLLDHLLRALGADQPRAPEVRLRQGVEVLDRCLVPLEHRVDAGVGYHVVQAATALRDLLHHRLDLSRIANVGDDGKAFATNFFDAAQGLGRVIRLAPVDPNRWWHL